MAIDVGDFPSWLERGYELLDIKGYPNTVVVESKRSTHYYDHETRETNPLDDVLYLQGRVAIGFPRFRTLEELVAYSEHFFEE